MENQIPSSQTGQNPLHSVLRGIRAFYSRKGAILKTIGIVIVLIVALPILQALLNLSTGISRQYVSKTAMYDGGGGMAGVPSSMLARESLGSGLADWGNNVMDSIAPSEMAAPSPAPIAGEEQGASVLEGTDEDYEVRSYNAQYRTGDIGKMCAAIEGLRARKEVIFENQSKSNTYCQYVFKVERASGDEILAFLKDLDPYQLSATTQSIKRTVEYQMSEITIQQNKLKAIEEALADAQKSYDEIQKVATSARDTESLTRIIENKLSLIDRLSREQLNVKQILDQLSVAKARELEKLGYVFFQVNVSQYKLADFRQIKDEWFSAVQEFVRTLSGTLQGVTITLLAIAVKFAAFAIYLVLGVFVVKYGWRLLVKIWRM